MFQVFKVSHNQLLRIPTTGVHMGNPVQSDTAGGDVCQLANLFTGWFVNVH